MKFGKLLLLVVFLFAAASIYAQDDNVIIIEGGAGNAGKLESTINGDTTATGERANPNRIYELQAGQFYIMHAAININNPGGTLTIRGQKGGAKPVIIKQPLEEVEVGPARVKSSLALQNIQYHHMATDGSIPWAAFVINGDNHHLLVEDCLIENCNGFTFNMNNVTQGAKAKIRNSYFRDFHDGAQWWAGRVLMCKVPMDTLIFENNTVTGAGLTILGQDALFDYAVINHNTFINNRKYPLMNVYNKEYYLTNNMFVNANMVGEDTVNIATGGQDPDALLHGIFGVDTIEINIGLQGKYINADTTELSEDIDEISDYTVYAADNVLVYSSTLDKYYAGEFNSNFNAPESYNTKAGIEGPHVVLNVPGIWMNERTQALVDENDNIKEENNSVYEMRTSDLGFGTDPLPQAAADVFIQWNRNKWGVPDIESPTRDDFKAYQFGDYDPLTVPGVETESAESGAGGITKISDMVEDFSYTANLVSKSDGLPIGAVHWFDIDFDGEKSLAKVKNAFNGIFENPDAIKDVAANEFKLKNYPNPCGEKTTISFTLPMDSDVKLSVFDVSGKLVRSLINEHKTIGAHSIDFNTNDLNGIYFYKLTTHSTTATGKMLIIK